MRSGQRGSPNVPAQPRDGPAPGLGDEVVGVGGHVVVGASEVLALGIAL